MTEALTAQPNDYDKPENQSFFDNAMSHMRLFSDQYQNHLISENSVKLFALPENPSPRKNTIIYSALPIFPSPCLHCHG
jgi:hypothetical protein